MLGRSIYEQIDDLYAEIKALKKREKATLELYKEAVDALRNGDNIAFLEKHSLGSVNKGVVIQKAPPKRMESKEWKQHPNDHIPTPQYSRYDHL